MTMALSYSRIADARLCLLKFKGKYIEKWPNMIMRDDQKSPALVRGGNIHKALDEYVKTKLRGEVPQSLMPEVNRLAPLIDQIMVNYNVNTEKQIAIDENFKEVSWFDKKAYFRVIMDLVGFGRDLLLIDHKTGKFADYEGSMDCLGQLHMSALVGMSLWPEYEECKCLYIFVDHKKVIPVKFDRSNLEPMKKKLVEEHALINAETEFAPTKNRYCHFCEAVRSQCNYATKN
jgi:CRISPR/Cas system-associated exonuclease Cas4 (RecB family)